MPNSLLVEPSFRSAPAFEKTLGPEVSDLATAAGFEPDPEQRLGLDLIFAMNRNKVAAFEFAVICARQNLKTGLFKQAGLGWLFLTGERLVVWSAHEFKTAKEAHRDMAQLIDSNGFLSRRLKRVYYGAGDESIELMSGARMLFQARTRTGGRGFSGGKNVYDEAFALRPAHIGASLPMLSVQPDPQVLYGSSAGMAESEVLRGIRDRGRRGGGRLAYIEWAAPSGGCARDRCEHTVGAEGCALDRVENWRAANPLLGRTRANGTGLTLEYLRAEREALPPAEFARERLGWWDEPGASEIFGSGKWEACASGDPQGLRMGALGVAVSLDLSHAAVVAAAQDGVTWVKPLHHAPGTGWVVERLRELQGRHQVVVVVDGRGPGAPLIPHIEAAGVSVHPATTPEVLDACAHFHGLVTGDLLRHAKYPELDAAVNGATTRAVGDRWAWGRRTSTSDISPLEAATLAAWWVSRPGVPFESVYESRAVMTV